MEKINVEICCGTACYILGASRLLELSDTLPAELKDRVEILARPCLDLCERENLGGAPYVRINGGEVMSQATNERVIDRLMELVGGAE